MRQNFSSILSDTLEYEGGWADHPKDPGGATMRGITLSTFRRYYPGASKSDLRNISRADIERIYRDGYWSKIKGDQLPSGIDQTAFDYGVNSGPSRSAKDLQRVVKVAADGVIGPKTLDAVIKADAKTVIQKHCARRLAFYQRLKTWKTFGRGWSRRIASVEAKAVALMMKNRNGGFLTSANASELEAEAAKAKRNQVAQDTSNTAIVGGGGGGVVTSGSDVWVTVAVVSVIAILAFVIYLKSRQNKFRAEAYREALKGEY